MVKRDVLEKAGMIAIVVLSLAAIIMSSVALSKAPKKKSTEGYFYYEEPPVAAPTALVPVAEVPVGTLAPPPPPVSPGMPGTQAIVSQASAPVSTSSTTVDALQAMVQAPAETVVQQVQPPAQQQLAQQYCNPGVPMPDYVSPEFVDNCVKNCTLNGTVIPEYCPCACARSNAFLMGIGL